MISEGSGVGVVPRAGNLDGVGVGRPPMSGVNPVFLCVNKTHSVSDKPESLQDWKDSKSTTGISTVGISAGGSSLVGSGAPCLVSCPRD